MLPKLRKNLTKQYNQLIELTHNKQYTVYIELTDEFIYLTFEPIQITENKTPKQRVAAIDMNPEYIGFSITDYTNGQKVLFTQTFDVSCFVKKLGLSSNHIKQKKQVRKHHYELIEIAKRLTNIARHYNCKSFAIEDLNLQNNKLNKEANRKNKNKWCRQLLVKQIKKRCKIYNIKLEEINPAYSSFIDNVLHEYPDMVAASIEIGRRGHYHFVKGKFYPKLCKNEKLPNKWKEEEELIYKNWVQLYNKIVKTLKLKYRRSLEEYSSKVCRFNSPKSHVILRT